MTDNYENMINDGGPERIWIESDGGCPYFYPEEELSDVAPPITEYVRADKLQAEIEGLREQLRLSIVDQVNAEAEANDARAEVEALRAEVERLNRILGRIVEGDGDSTLTIRAGTDAFAAAREYLMRDQEDGRE
jgi:hypothetical protein